MTQTSTSLSAEYAIMPLNYPHDMDEWLDMLEDAFSKDPTMVHVDASSKNPTTAALRRHMRIARFKNGIEGLAPEAAGTECIYTKLVHVPTGAIAGGTVWQIPSRTATVTKSEQTQTDSQPAKVPYPLLPSGSEIAPEDKALKGIGPAMNGALEEMALKNPMLGAAETRNQHWWYLSSLGIASAHQGRRLGQALVQWGVERAMEDAAERPEKEIKGAWLVATEAGRKTYANVGFKSIATTRVVYGDDKGGAGVQIFHEEDAHKAVGNGQNFVAFVKEFDQTD